MAEEREGRRRDSALDQPREKRRRLAPRRPRVPRMDAEGFGRLSEGFARFMGTPQFLLYMTIFVVVWLLWNTYAPEAAQFDPRALNYTLLTLILSLQASYAAPLILLAQNRQDDRDRVGLEQDRQRAERNLADTEYLAREVAALRLAVGEVATRDFVRSELRALLEEVELLAADARRDDDDGRLDRPLERTRDRTREKGRGRGRQRGAGPDRPEPDDADADADAGPDPDPDAEGQRGQAEGSTGPVRVPMSPG